jgi:hypothetical protein
MTFSFSRERMCQLVQSVYFLMQQMSILEWNETIMQLQDSHITSSLLTLMYCCLLLELSDGHWLLPNLEIVLFTADLAPMYMSIWWAGIYTFLVAAEENNTQVALFLVKICDHASDQVRTTKRIASWSTH